MGLRSKMSGDGWMVDTPSTVTTTRAPAVLTMCTAYLRENGFDNLPRAKQDLMSVQYWPRSAGQGFYTASQNGQGG